MDRALDGYIRVSRVAGREGPRFISPDDQRERIAAHAAAQGDRIVRWHEDLDLPGSHSARPGLQAALDRVEGKQVEGLVVARLDRFGRSVIDTARNLERIEAAGGVLLTVSEGIDSSGAFGRFLVAITSAFAQLELDRIRENWRSARSRAVARGVHVASRTPTGYERDDVGVLVVGPHAPKVRAAFEARASGGSWGELAEVLAGVPTPYGAEHWTSRSLSHLIGNRVYLGEARSGEFVLPGAHPALVDEATWQQAQRRKGPPPSHGRSLLAGLLRCGGCRYALKPDTVRDRGGERVRMYRCRGRRAAGDCGDRAAVLGSVVEPFVVERFFKRIGDVEAKAYLADEALEAVERRREIAAAELATYRDETVASAIGRDAYVEGLQVRAEGLREAERELAEMRERAGLAELPDVETLRDRWPEMPLSAQRELLSAGIDAIVLRSSGQANVPIADRLGFLWRGEAPDDLPGPGRRLDEIRPFDWSSVPADAGGLPGEVALKGSGD